MEQGGLISPGKGRDSLEIWSFMELVYLAFRERFNPAAHKRLILIATITLMEAAINRWQFPIFQRSPFMFALISAKPVSG